MSELPEHLGKYEILGEVGRGGFATVYEAQDGRLNRRVALKVITSNFARDKSFIRRFEQEAHTAASLHHPRIVTIYDFGELQGFFYLAMRLIKGRTLRQYLDQYKRLTLEQALPILTQLADALDYLNERKLVHRDLKPGNVLLEERGKTLSATLTDFGLVRSLERSVTLTQSEGVLGTPAYLAPEQIDPRQWGEVSPLTDVYSLGILAYEMLVGQLPFDGQLIALLRAHSDTPPPPPDLDEDLSQVLLKALAKVMVRVPAAEYSFNNSKNLVSVDEFWVDQTVVTNAEYKKFLDANPDYPVPYLEGESVEYNWDPRKRMYPSSKANCPVTLISWQDALAYSEWAGKRLLTEYEWELAARSTDGREYPWGNDPPTPARCNYGTYFNSLTPVGHFSPHGDSPYGCADMSGNVWEWTISELTMTGRMLRGGSWNSLKQHVRVITRYNSTLHFAPDIRLNNVGIRCAVVLSDD
jgi:serine/threonine protein kinase